MSMFQNPKRPIRNLCKKKKKKKKKKTNIIIDENFYRFGYVKDLEETKIISIQKKYFEYVVETWQKLDRLQIL